MIRIEHLNYSVGAFALQDVCLQVAPSEYFVLLGPTGSGKTLLIECLCGLNRVDAGRVFVAGADVTDLEPRHRGVGYLPQDYALFPHRSVRQNIAFGLGRRDGAAVPVREQVEQLMARLGVRHLADRRPRNLSGGEKQRVALARALAVRPRVLLLDEPVSALDESTRDGVCRMLRQVQRDTHTSTIHVCHNFVEMMSVADRVGVIQQGRIVQVGTPQEVLQRPVNTAVAQFVQAGNLLSARATIEGEVLRLKCVGGIELWALRGEQFQQQGDVTVMVRPENIRLLPADPRLDPPPEGAGVGVLEGTLREAIDLGPTVKAQVACRPEVEFAVSLGKREYRELGVTVGDRVRLQIPAGDVHVMRATSRTLGATCNAVLPCP